MLSAGPDSVILTNLPALLKRRGGKVGITVQAVVEFARAAACRASRWRSTAIRRDVSWCIVGNARCYGGPWAAHAGRRPVRAGVRGRDAQPARPRRGRAVLLRHPVGRHLRLRGVERSSGQRGARSSGREDVPYQLDGDPAGHLPVTARSSDERVWVLVRAARGGCRS